MHRTRRPILLALITACGLALATSCEREKRGFHVPASEALAPEAVPANSTIRPGPNGPVTPTGQQAVDVGRRSVQAYGSSYPNNAQALSDGQTLYESMNCVGCHAHGGGGIGPPLMDNKWFYGSEPSAVYQTILEGRPNGMPSFRGRIADYQIWELVAFVRSMSGQANSNAAPGREDHMRGPLPPNSSKEKPEGALEPSTLPAVGAPTGLVKEPATKSATKPSTNSAATTQGKP